MTIDCNQAGIGCISQFGYTGVSTWGYPVDPAGNNCTNYVAFRLARNGATNPGRLGDAHEWAANAAAKGFAVNQTPAVGSVAWFSASSSWAPGTGHVAYVEAVSGGTLSLSDSNYQGGSKRWRVSAGEAAYPNGFIHIKDVGAPAPIGDGTFVARQGSGEVYVMAGDSPVYVSTWDAFGGPKPVQVLPAAQFDALRPEPADGTFIFGTRTGRVFSVAGGAPVYLSNWNNVGGQAGKRVVGVDDWAIDNAGHPLSHLRQRPKDGAFLGSSPSGRVFVIAGGAPLYVSNWNHIGGPRPVAPVDDWSVDNAGHPESHLDPVPQNGYYLNAQPSGRVFITAWGAPLHLSNWAHVGGQAGKPIVTVDDWAVDNAGHPASHLVARPYDGNFLVGRPSGRVFRVAGGSPIYVSSWDRVGGPQPTVSVDDWAIDQAGHPLSHLLKFPADGTLLRARPSNVRWQVNGGQRSTSPGEGGIVVDEVGLGRVPLRPATSTPNRGGTPGSGTPGGGTPGSGTPGSSTGSGSTPNGPSSSSGPRLCTVPRLAGLTVRAAKTRLVRNGCRLGAITYVGRKNPRADKVVSVKRRVGVRLARGASVAVTVRR
ncbi:CHAP domain-containing protein [Miltoncostaea oceani]|uniref:CHAP domain-containing protein n=1 Tax=Miltoncostaea oceani TaxID=2843216 RepID=UPI001C3C1CA5|nr:CHAP domain-containing protein [Miltoncostaea oceani]